MNNQTWYYYSVESKHDQYGSRVTRVRKMSRAKALDNSTGCADAGGCSAGAYRATTASVAAMKAAMKAAMDAPLHWSDSRATHNGITIECLS